jgi:hypothetical protein
MHIKENLKPEKANVQTVAFRTPASYKKWLEEMAAEYGYNVSELLNNWVRRHIFGHISFKARLYALEQVCPKYGIPESFIKRLQNGGEVEDWKELKAFIGDKNYEKFSSEYHRVRDNKADEIAGDDGFEWNYDTNTGLIS